MCAASGRLCVGLITLLSKVEDVRSSCWRTNLHIEDDTVWMMRLFGVGCGVWTAKGIRKWIGGALTLAEWLWWQCAYVLGVAVADEPDVLRKCARPSPGV